MCEWYNANPHSHPQQWTTFHLQWSWTSGLNTQWTTGLNTRLIYSSLDDPKWQMHKVAVKQPHESILILLRYRTNGHKASVFYRMRQTAIVYITVVILLTARKTGGVLGIHLIFGTKPYVNYSDLWNTSPYVTESRDFTLAFPNCSPTTQGRSQILWIR